MQDKNMIQPQTAPKKPAAASRNVQEQIANTLAEVKQNDERAFVTAVGRGILILSTFESQQTLSHQQICQQTGLPKATISRLLHTLERLDMLHRNKDDQYRLGKSLLKISASAWQGHNLVEEALPLLKDFALTHQVSVNIATEMDAEMRYLACYRSPARLAVSLSAGSCVPIESTAIGRAYYSILPAAAQIQLITEMAEKSALDPQQLAAMLKVQQNFYQQQGYCLSDGDYSADILAVAMPVYDKAHGRYTHALNASVPKAKWQTEDYIEYIVPKLQGLCAQIEAL